ncbi:hypothetical protein [Halalkalibacter akibai]|uniref:Uncharacterized protein n=1 Tax=Halalkalibacter akibai (strain ATCC 43226 / DSM 21942 / CIP 109018 / JCM 9157 / 1139) TaxID=1236973 RepID=W4QX68_HALA3|nr:hypothetical protein [Halalkalibacter akibai]GAE36730.1 hypothetical protein JCM9157_3946 [Halalkalibacter akibai JCM 9157]
MRKSVLALSLVSTLLMSLSGCAGNQANPNNQVQMNNSYHNGYVGTTSQDHSHNTTNVGRNDVGEEGFDLYGRTLTPLGQKKYTGTPGYGFELNVGRTAEQARLQSGSR